MLLLDVTVKKKEYLNYKKDIITHNCVRITEHVIHVAEQIFFSSEAGSRCDQDLVLKVQKCRKAEIKP